MTEQEQQIVLDLFLNENKTIAKISKITDISSIEIEHFLRERYFLSSRKPRLYAFPVAEVREMAKTHTAMELAEHYGIPLVSFYKKLQDNGITPIKKHKHTSEGTELMKAVAEELREPRTLSYTQIADKYGITKQRVSQIKQRYYN